VTANAVSERNIIKRQFTGLLLLTGNHLLYASIPIFFPLPYYACNIDALRYCGVNVNFKSDPICLNIAPVLTAFYQPSAANPAG